MRMKAVKPGMMKVPESAVDPTEPRPVDSAALSCCSAFYELDWVRLLAEDIFHPGGEALTRKTLAAMNLPPRSAIADLGCGTGTSALLLAGEFDLQVSAVDASSSNIARASARIEPDDPPIEFLVADAHDLPFENAQFDAVLAECTFSLFSDQARALSEIRRVLKPHGQLGVTDMATGGLLAEDISQVLAPWTCLADAVDQDEYAKRFRSAGFSIEEIADESQGLEQMISALKRKLLMLSMGALMPGQSLPELDFATIRHWLQRFREEVDQGAIRYLRFQLRAPG